MLELEFVCSLNENKDQEHGFELGVSFPYLFVCVFYKIVGLTLK